MVIALAPLMYICIPVLHFNVTCQKGHLIGSVPSMSITDMFHKVSYMTMTLYKVQIVMRPKKINVMFPLSLPTLTFCDDPKFLLSFSDKDC